MILKAIFIVNYHFFAKLGSGSEYHKIHKDVKISTYGIFFQDDDIMAKASPYYVTTFDKRDDIPYKMIDRFLVDIYWTFGYSFYCGEYSAPNNKGS